MARMGTGLRLTRCQRIYPAMTQFTVELDRETDGRWIAEIPALPGALCYDDSKGEASRKCEALALRILADRIEIGL